MPVGKVEENVSATSPPLVVGDRVLVGMAGGDYRSRGFIDAYQAETGKRLWRFYTVPGWSGGATWLNGSYDPDLNQVYWGVGNPILTMTEMPARATICTPTPWSRSTRERPVDNGITNLPRMTHGTMTVSMRWC